MTPTESKPKREKKEKPQTLSIFVNRERLGSIMSLRPPNEEQRGGITIETAGCAKCDDEMPLIDDHHHSDGSVCVVMYCEKTCGVCAEIRSAFTCDEGAGPAFGNLWSDLTDCFRDLSTTCFDRLESVDAKKYLRERWMTWKGLAA